MGMDADLLKAYRKRWQAVDEIEREEARTASYELRWRQLREMQKKSTITNVPLVARNVDKNQKKECVVKGAIK